MHVVISQHLVWLKAIYKPTPNVSRKFNPTWVGPFVVVEIVSEVNYSIRYLEKENSKPIIVHLSRLKPYYEEQGTEAVRINLSVVKQVEKGEFLNPRRETIEINDNENNHNNNKHQRRISSLKNIPPLNLRSLIDSTSYAQTLLIGMSLTNIPTIELEMKSANSNTNNTPLLFDFLRIKRLLELYPHYNNFYTLNECGEPDDYHKRQINIKRESNMEEYVEELRKRTIRPFTFIFVHYLHFTEPSTRQWIRTHISTLFPLLTTEKLIDRDNIFYLPNYDDFLQL